MRPTQRYRHLHRYREIAQVLIRHGFGELLDQMELLPVLALPRRLLRRDEREMLGAPQRLRLALEELGPTFVKFGQILSTRPDLLPPAYIAELSKLQDTVPPAPWEVIKPRIEEELGGPLDTLFATFDPDPMAAASLAQVHAATLTSGDQVVVKVQRPGIRRTIDVDLEILYDLARLAQERTPLGRLYDLVEIAEDFATTLRNELDYRREGRNADRFRQNFADEPYIYIPRVYWDYTTGRVLTLERISGIKIDDIVALDEAGYDRHQIALNAARIIIKEVLIDGFFHADPHPGNFVVMPGHVIGAMDFGMVGHLSPHLKEDLVQLYIASVRLDSEGIIDQLIRMGAAQGRVDRERLRRDLERLLTKYQGVPLKEIRAKEVVEEIMPIAYRHHLRLPSDLWLLGKTLAMMEGIGLKLDPDFDVFAISEPYVRRFLWQMYSPTLLGRKLLTGVSDWSDFLLDLPKQVPRLLDQMERGDIQINVDIPRADSILSRLDRIANRLAISLLVAAFIMALALLIPTLNLVQPWQLTTWLVVSGFVVAVLLGLWLLFSIWRSGRWRGPGR
ncbi:MAG TPA: AarF/ABC1/UbiB kinase family protein [Caldilineae bacterium]|nr:AarF/ABC1/UbiB kinase family protein [Caldilineae bacterium]